MNLTLDLIQAVLTFGLYFVIHKYASGGESIYFLGLIYALQVRRK